MGLPGRSLLRGICLEYFHKKVFRMLEQLNSLLPFLCPWGWVLISRESVSLKETLFTISFSQSLLKATQKRKLEQRWIEKRKLDVWNSTWYSGAVPLDWQIRLVVLILKWKRKKKADRTVFSNCGYITILSLQGGSLYQGAWKDKCWISDSGGRIHSLFCTWQYTVVYQVN